MLLANLLALAGAALLLAMVPGPSTAVVLRQTLRSGRRAGLAATLANELGSLFWVVMAAVGLSALVAASEAAYNAIGIIGALVLIYLGVQSLWRSRHRAPVIVDDAAVLDTKSGEMSRHGQGQTAASANHATWSAFRVGLVTTIANPKAAVFAASFLPQFVPPHAPLFATLLLLAIVWFVVDACWYVVLIWMVNRAQVQLARPAVQRRLERVTGLVLLGFGARLALERR